MRRRPNPRGQGGRLREEIIGAASTLLADSGGASQLSLRAVARQVGITTTSIYPHFPDVEHLAAAVAERHFLALAEVVAAASENMPDPGEVLLARCRAYCHFALEHPGPYRIMVQVPRPDLVPPAGATFPRSPGGPSFLDLTRDIERCQRAGSAYPRDDPAWLAGLVWASLHGLVALRISRPGFPWPPLDAQVDGAVARLAGLDWPHLPQAERPVAPHGAASWRQPDSEHPRLQHDQCGMSTKL
ncbi:MAG: TetR/AcrR family transcriptional regulator [Chloroflexota bacterium]|nr:TetR/AcrR family transcriptional regulator [Chloroflexota bacterium]